MPTIGNHNGNTFGRIQHAAPAYRYDPIALSIEVGCCPGHDFGVFGIGGEVEEHGGRGIGLAQQMEDVGSPTSIHDSWIRNHQGSCQTKRGSIPSQSMACPWTKDNFGGNELAQMLQGFHDSLHGSSMVGERKVALRYPKSKENARARRLPILV
jgi:hypothetical protein